MFGWKPLRIVAALVFGTLVIGCGSYKEPALSPAETALLKTKGGCTIDSVDGQGVPHMAVTMGGFIGGNEVRVTPGTHTILVKHVVNNGTWTYRAALFCERSHTYIIEPNNMFGGDMTAKDATTGQMLRLPPMAMPVAAVPGVTVAPPTTVAVATTAPAQVSAPTAIVPAPSQVSNDSDDEEADLRPRIGIRSPHIMSSSDDTGTAIKVTADVRLKNVPNQPFTFRGILTDASGVPLKDAGGEFTAFRTVMTGDDEDTDDYTFKIPCQRLYTWKQLPSVIYVQLTLVDQTGKVRATGPLLSYTVTGR